MTDVWKEAEKAREKRRKLIADLTLQGKFWGKDGALRLEEEFLMICKMARLRFATEKFRIPNFVPAITAEFFSAASSTYYTASANASAHAKQSANLFSKLFWYWRAWICLRKAKKYSDKFAELKSIEDMTLGELDTRACVLNKCGRRQEALDYLSHGIMKLASTGIDNDPEVENKHDLCLFLIHKAEILLEMKNKDKKAQEDYDRAIRLSDYEDEVPILTRVRVWKSYGKFSAETGYVDISKYALGKALFLAKKNGLSDQEQKILAIDKKYKLTLS